MVERKLVGSSPSFKATAAALSLSAASFINFLLIVRGLMIAAAAQSSFSRLLAGAISLVLFTYAFVNVGMVTGILPVVGVPLPMVSYGGTALVTIFVCIGILMSIQTHRMLLK